MAILLVVSFYFWGAALSGFYGLGKGQHKDQNIGHKTT